MKKIKKIFLSTLIAVAVYASLIAFPLQYFPLPGYRGIGEPLQGGWRWGNSFGCFDDVPVLYFKGNDAFLVQEGEIIWKLFTNVETNTVGGLLELTGKFYPYTDKEIRGVGPRGKPQSLLIRYNDVGKILHMRKMVLGGVPLRDMAYVKNFILAQCGYPGLTLNMLYLFGIRKYWRDPGRDSGRDLGHDQRQPEPHEPGRIQLP